MNPLALAIGLGLSVTMISVTCLGGVPDLPPDDTPGALNPTINQSNIAQTICVPNYTAAIRPPVSYTNRLKAEKMQKLGLTGNPRDWELDHRVPLSVAGDPTSPENLYPEPWTGPHGAHAKDVLEAAIHRKICRGEITLAQGQAIFLAPHDWRVDYDALYGKHQ